MENEAFLKAILESPTDAALRLVYADWLEEHGDPSRAEFLRLELKLLELPSDEERFPAFQKRLQELNQVLDPRWITLFRKQRVMNLIRNVFQGVTLGDGVGLLQGMGLVDYANASTLAAYRARDEKHDWSAIPPAELNRCHTSLSYFDAEGMRFHLPAYLLAYLEGTLEQDIIYHLTHFEILGFSQFAKLSAGQRGAVREFLLLHLSDPDCDFERPQVENALCEYWTPK